MSIIFTESFQRFGRVTFSGAYSSPTQLFMQDPGYTVTGGWSWSQSGSSNAVADSSTWPDKASSNLVSQLVQGGVAADPVSPTKNRWISHGQLDVNSTSLTTFRTTLRRKFDKPTNHWIMGFLVRAVAGTLTSTVGAIDGIAIGGYTSAFRSPTLSLSSMDNIRFAAGHDVLTLCRGITANQLVSTTSIPATTGMFYSNQRQSTAQIVPMNVNTDYFVEVEVDLDKLVCNVWVDDFLVMQPVITSAIADSFKQGFAIAMTTSRTDNGTSKVASAYGCVAISDLYVLDASDNVSPVTRLGPSTRVWGDSPTGDVKEGFSRPDGYDSNAAVVSKTIDSNAMPTDYLTGDGENIEDLYSFKKSVGAISNAVYGVTVRMQAANGGTTQHSMSAVADAGTSSTESSFGDYAPATGYSVRMASFPTAPDGTQWTPEKVDQTNFGVKIDT